MVITDDLMALSLGKDPNQFISLKACLNSSSSAAVGSMTSMTEAVPDSTDIKPLFLLLKKDIYKIKKYAI